MYRPTGVLRSLAQLIAGRRVSFSALLLVVLLTGSFALPGSKAYAKSAHAQHKGSSLAIHVSGLPPGVAASIRVHGPHFSTTLKGSRTIRDIRPVRSTCTVRQVTIACGHGVRAGSLALPARAQQ